MAHQPSPHEEKSSPGEPPHLSDIESAFVDQYLVDLNAAAAYRRVKPGVSVATAKTSGPEMLRRPHVAAEAERRRAVVHAAVEQETGITVARVVEELGHVGFFDPGELFDKDGKRLPIHKLPEKTRRAIAGFSLDEVAVGEGEAVVTKVRIKAAPKVDALDKLMRRFGAYQDKLVIEPSAEFAEIVLEAQRLRESRRKR